MFTVSVIIPCYNAEYTIERAILSVLNQNFEIRELIIINDGSTDNTIKKIEKLDHRNKNIIKIISQNNLGPSAARNNGIENASSDLIAFLDSDDYWHKEKIKKQIEIFEEFVDCGIVSCLNNKKLSKKKCKNITFRKLLFKNYIGTSTVVIKKEYFSYFKFNIKQKYSEDYRLWLQLVKRVRCKLILEQLCFQDDKPVFGFSGLSANIWKMEKGELSNYYYLLKNKEINIFLFVFVVCFSIIKFIFRLFSTVMRKRKKVLK